MRSHHLGTAIALAVVLLVGCENYTEEIRGLCDSPVRAGPKANAFDMSQSYGQAYERVKSKKGKELVDHGIPGVNPAEKARLLRAAATEQGLASCAMADHWLEEASADETFKRRQRH
jgi:hypothetical protein